MLLTFIYISKRAENVALVSSHMWNCRATQTVGSMDVVVNMARGGSLPRPRHTKIPE
jgi:hypothetical protein